MSISAVPMGEDMMEEISTTCACDLCFELFDSDLHTPLSLSCGHSFCKSCIGLWQSVDNSGGITVKCPKCACDTNVPNGKTLPINYAILALVDKLGADREPVVKCSECSKKFTQTYMRACVNKDCNKFKKPCCAMCILEYHQGHPSEKYDHRFVLREETVNELMGVRVRMEEKKKALRDKAIKLSQLVQKLDKSWSAMQIPAPLFAEAEKVTNDEQKLMVLDAANDLCELVTSGCVELSSKIDETIQTAYEQFRALFEEETEEEMDIPEPKDSSLGDKEREENDKTPSAEEEDMDEKAKN